MSDLLLPKYGVDSLRYAMLLLTFGHLWAALHLWTAARTLRADLALLVADEVRWEKVIMGGRGGARGYQQLDRMPTLAEDPEVEQKVQCKPRGEDNGQPPRP